jgi:hypothetical protein
MNPLPLFGSYKYKKVSKDAILYYFTLFLFSISLAKKWVPTLSPEISRKSLTFRPPNKNLPFPPYRELWLHINVFIGLRCQLRCQSKGKNVIHI